MQRHHPPRYLTAAPALLTGLYAAVWRSSRGPRQKLLDGADEVAALAMRLGMPVLADDAAVRRACEMCGVALVGQEARD